MANSADALRRWFGLFFLTTAAGMLIWGQTILKPHLEGFIFMVYWLACFIFTFLAIITALLDVRATRQRTEAEQRELLDRTMTEIKTKEKPPEDSTAPPPNEV